MEIKIPAIGISFFAPTSDVHIDVGYNHVVIDKAYGPEIFDDIRIHPDHETYCWIIERQNEQDEWVECARIPAILDARTLEERIDGEK